MAGDPPSEIYYAAGPDGGPPEMDPPPHVRPTAKKEAPPAPSEIQWYLVDGCWVCSSVEPQPAPKPEEDFQRYMPDWDGGPPCGGRVPVKAVPVEPSYTIYCSGGCCDCTVEEAPPPPPECDYCSGATCGTSCCGHWYDAPPPSFLKKRKDAPKKAPPPPPPIAPCSGCTFCCLIKSCSTCSTTPCSKCSPEPKPEKIIIKIKRPNRADFSMEPNMTYLGPDKVMTTVNIIHGAHKPWEHPNVTFESTPYEIDSGVTIRTLIKRLGIPPGSGVCESVPVGNGYWLQASSYVPINRDALGEQLRDATLQETCDQTLAEAGWEGKTVWLLLWP